MLFEIKTVVAPSARHDGEILQYNVEQSRSS